MFNINAELLLDKKVYIVKPISETGQVISKVTLQMILLSGLIHITQVTH